jgi:serine protease Do
MNRPKLPAYLLLIPLLAAFSPQPAPAASSKDLAASDAALERAIGRVFPALVRIFVLSDEPGDGRMEKTISAGSGAVITEDGYVITNHHVAGKARHLVCRMADGEEIEATLIGTDALADIAVIKLDLSRRKKNTKLTVAKFGNSDKVKVGDTVLAMGSPMAVSQSVTKGIVANTSLMMPNFFGGSMRLDGESVGSLVRWIGHDAVIFGGNSGGPLVNLDGEIIGINEVGLASLGGAIPSNLAKSVAEQLMRRGSVARSWTGIEIQERMKSFAATRGALVAGVIDGSPAAQAGLRAGDIITEFDGVPVNAEIMEDVPVFNGLVMSTPIGKTVTVKVLRDGKEQKFQLTTRERGIATNKDGEMKDWGLTGRNFTMLSALERKRATTEGVQVTSVEMAGPAGSAVPPIAEGDIIVMVEDRPVKNMDDFRNITHELLAAQKEQRPVKVVFERGVSQYLTVAKLPRRELPPEETPRKPGLQMILQPVGTELAEVLGIKNGVRVAFVFPDRAAAKAGIRVGDILTRFDGEVIRCVQPEDVPQFVSRVRRYKVGTEVEVELLRGKTPEKVKMTLEADGPPADQLKRFKDRVFELTVRELTEMERATLQIPDDVKGVLVDEVMTAGWASLARVGAGDILLGIDGTPTPDVATAEKLLKAAAEQKQRRIVFFLRRGIHTRFAELEPNWTSMNGAQATSAKK